MSITYHFAYSDAFPNEFCSKCEQISEYLKICFAFTKEILYGEHHLLCSVQSKYVKIMVI